ncbi:MAG: antitoxin MazE family protein, partial [Terriglobus roseus]|nr:antitoxin MazE family protein [Terriglobus roseus]
MATSRTGAQRVQRRRDKLRAAGLRPVQIWVPDTRAAVFAEECAQQACLIRTPEAADTAE